MSYRQQDRPIMKKSKKNKANEATSIEKTYQMAGLVDRYFKSQLSGEENEELERWLGEDPGRRQILEDLSDPGYRKALLSELNTYDLKEGYRALVEKIDLQPSKRLSKKKGYRQILATAAVLIVLLTGAFFLKNYLTKSRQETAKAVSPVQDIPPGGNRATLTLAGGSMILLDSAQNGLLARQGGTKVIKLNNGQLAYQGARNTQGTVTYNTITTPRGGEYKVTLPDGSNVFLNAASSLTYPTAFPKDRRSVKLTGEAYFEIAPNSKSPFLVQVDSMQVQVLGTAFNIMAYPEESTIRTTLVEGAVKVLASHQEKALKPNQQAILNSDGQLSLNTQANINEAIAWKNGYFQYSDATIDDIMKDVSRWYNVKIEYDGTIHRHFVARISRDEPVSRLLQLLELTHSVHFNIESNKIIVRP